MNNNKSTNSARHQLRLFAAHLLIAFALVSSALAEDVEIYINQGATVATPNLLLIIDTSGSMLDAVYSVAYDPQIDYQALLGTLPPPTNPTSDLVRVDPRTFCDNDSLYWGLATAEPFGPAGSHPTDCRSDGVFPKDANKCNESWMALDMNNPSPGPSSDPASTGFYIGDIAIYAAPANQWASPQHTIYGQRYVHVECQADQILTPPHGETTTGPPFVSSVTGPYVLADAGYRWGAQFYSHSIVIYSGNFMNFLNYAKNYSPAGSITTRMEVVRNTLKDLISIIPPIRVGLMETDTNLRFTIPPICTLPCDGGDITYPITWIGEVGSAERIELTNIIDNIQPSGSTPLTESIHEAYNYWTGSSVNYGNDNVRSVAGSRDPPVNSSSVYASPLGTDCAENFQVLLTDGQPALDDASDSDIQQLIQTANSQNSWPGPNDPVHASLSCEHVLDSNDFVQNTCLDDLTEYMNKVDITTGGTPNVRHTVSTHIVGFNLSTSPAAASSKPFLDAATNYGGGSFFDAGNSVGLAAAFRQIVSDIIVKDATTFSSPAISVNALSRLVHNNELYFALFEPGYSEHWPGNIKRYRLDFKPSDQNGDGKVEVGEGKYEIVDANANSAVDPATGQLRDSALSWWRLSGNGPDGNTVEEGGLAHRLFDWNSNFNTFQADSRANTVYTYVEEYALTDFTGSGIPLIRLHENQAAINPGDQQPITRDTMGLPANYLAGEFTKLLRWSRGVDAYDVDGDGDDTEGRPQFGAPLHAKPVVVTYESNRHLNTQTDVVFSMTNDGYFHASRSHEVNSIQRLEYFSFIPLPLLKNLQLLQENKGSQPIYGLDGGLTIWRHDNNKDGNIRKQDNDQVVAYFGMRRGGRAIFALDVTDLTAPELLWVINPDNSQQRTDTRFAYLGQSWAEPQYTKMLIENGGLLQSTDVIVLSGGYDTAQDLAGGSRSSGDTVGHAIYIVDALTGELYWWAGKSNALDDQSLKFEHADMKWGFAGALSLVDINDDSIPELLYAADTGGQIWRFDIKNKFVTSNNKSLKTRITGGVIADIQKHNAHSIPDHASNRRFFHAPDITLVGIEDEPYLTIGLGSGYRPHPLDQDVDDRFYLIKDYDITGPPTNRNIIIYVKRYEEDFLDVTMINLADTATTLAASEKYKLKQGWLIKLADNEKVLARSVTVSGNIIFTTFTPPTIGYNPNTCAVNIGIGNAYTVRIDDARPVYDLAPSKDGILKTEDRKQELQSSGIPSAPLPIHTEGPLGKSTIVLVGKETLSDLSTTTSTVIQDPESSYWFQKYLQ